MCHSLVEKLRELKVILRVILVLLITTFSNVAFAGRDYFSPDYFYTVTAPFLLPASPEFSSAGEAFGWLSGAGGCNYQFSNLRPSSSILNSLLNGKDTWYEYDYLYRQDCSKPFDNPLTVGAGPVYMNYRCYKGTGAAFIQHQTGSPATLACFRDLPDETESPSSCNGVGNPIYPESQTKKQTEVDYVSQSGLLKIDRTYIGRRQPISMNYRAWTFSLISHEWADYTKEKVINGVCEPLTIQSNPPVQGYQLPTLVCARKIGTLQDQYVLTADKGRKISFNKDALGVISPSLNINTRITKVGQGSAIQTHVRNEDNTLTVYDNTGVLVEKWDASGNFLRIGNNKIVDSFGRILSFQIASSGQITTITDPAGGVIIYGYEENGCTSMSGCAAITSVTYQDGIKRYYYYDETGLSLSADKALLTGVADEFSIGDIRRYSTYTYDAGGRAVSTEFAGGVNKYSVFYSYAPTVTDPLGAQRTSAFTAVLGYPLLTYQSQPAGSGCNAASSAISYDTQGNPTSRDNFNSQRTCYAYDLTRNLETIRVEGLSNAAACPAALNTYTPPASTATSAIRKVSTQWHPDWRMEVRKAEAKLITTNVYNGQPDPTAANATASCAPTTALLPDGKPIAVLCKKVEQPTTDAAGGAGFSAVAQGAARVWSYTYNSFGQVLTANGPRTDVTDVTTYTYHPATTVDVTMGDMATMTNAAGHVTSYPKYDKHGNVQRKVEPNGVTTDYTYDLRQRLKTVTITPAGGATALVPALVTSYTYDAVGQMTKATQPDGSFTAYTYDAAHRLTDVSDSLGNTMHYTLDNMGNRVKEEGKDPAGALKRNIARVYDALNRLQNVTGAAQ